ncbi:MAG: cytochrome c553 [Gammaproteobacteria bacterium]|jgi:cytochrome c553
MKFLVTTLLIVISLTSSAQGINYKMGRTATDEEIKALDVTLDPSGDELPQGSGTAEQGAVIYRESCVNCHGLDGVGDSAPQLIGFLRIYPIDTWDKIYRTMPLSITKPGTREKKLHPDETYALTAYILYINGMTAENDILNNYNLAEVRIPDPQISR